MGDHDLRFPDDYEKFFDPRVYLQSSLSLEDSSDRRWQIHSKLLHYHEFWTSLQSSNLTMLEFGAGPSIYSLISACPHVKEIVIAEFTEPNRNEVNAWLRKDASAFDWSPYFKHVVQTLEGKTQQDSVDREEQLRQKITRVIPCDIRQQQPLKVKEAQGLKFDVVASTACLGGAVTSDDMYCKAVAKLAELLKPGGHLMLAGYLNSTYYFVGNEKFICSPINESLVQKALDESEIEILHFNAMKRPDGQKNAAMIGNYQGMFFTWGILKNGK